MIPSRHIKLARTMCAAPAAPAGGGPVQGCRGCGIKLMSALFFSLIGCAAQAQTARLPKSVDVPSHQPMSLTEVFLDDTPGEIWLRLRFVAPEIARESGTVPHHVAAQDMEHLCAHVALPMVAQSEVVPQRIAISLSDRVVDFGARDVRATQYFETYRPENGACVWEGL